VRGRGTKNPKKSYWETFIVALTVNIAAMMHSSDNSSIVLTFIYFHEPYTQA